MRFHALAFAVLFVLIPLAQAGDGLLNTFQGCATPMTAQTFQACTLKLRERVEEIFDLGDAASVGTTSLDNALTRISWSGDEITYTPLVSDFFVFVAESNVAFLPPVAPGRLAYVNTKGLVLFDQARRTVRWVEVLHGFDERFEAAALLNGGMVVATSLEVTDVMDRIRRLRGLQLTTDDVEVRWELLLPEGAEAHVSRRQIFVFTKDGVVRTYDRDLRSINHPLTKLPELLHARNLPELSGLTVHPDEPLAVAVDRNGGGHLISWREGGLTLLFSQPDSIWYEFSPDGAYVLFWVDRAPTFQLHVARTTFPQGSGSTTFATKQIAVFDRLPSKRGRTWLSNPTGYAMVDEKSQTLYYWNLAEIMR